MAPDPTRHDRRESDQAMEFLKDKVNDIGDRLERHVTDCAEQSKKLFWAVLSLLGFLVLKSLPFLSKMFPG